MEASNSDAIALPANVHPIKRESGRHFTEKETTCGACGRVLIRKIGRLAGKPFYMCPQCASLSWARVRSGGVHLEPDSMRPKQAVLTMADDGEGVAAASVEPERESTTDELNRLRGEVAALWEYVRADDAIGALGPPPPTESADFSRYYFELGRLSEVAGRARAALGEPPDGKS